MVQRDNVTVNPAGSPTVKQVAGTQHYTRDDYLRDLRKVSKKVAPKRKR